MAERVELSERDVAILELLLARRAETLDELHARFFANATLKTARNRLHRLQQGGYLERMSMPLYKGIDMTSIYMLGPRARAALLRRSPAAQEAYAGHSYNATKLITGLDARIMLNRIADWVGTELYDQHPLAAAAGASKRDRPYAVYQARSPDWQGRSLVFVEIGFRYLWPDRLLDKVSAFLDNPHAAALLIAAPGRRREGEIACSIRSHWGENVMRRIQILTFNELYDGGYLRDSLQSAHDQHPHHTI